MPAVIDSAALLHVSDHFCRISCDRGNVFSVTERVILIYSELLAEYRVLYIFLRTVTLFRPARLFDELSDFRALGDIHEAVEVQTVVFFAFLEYAHNTPAAARNKIAELFKQAAHKFFFGRKQLGAVSDRPPCSPTDLIGFSKKPTGLRGFRYGFIIQLALYKQRARLGLELVVITVHFVKLPHELARDMHSDKLALRRRFIFFVILRQVFHVLVQRSKKLVP